MLVRCDHAESEWCPSVVCPHKRAHEQQPDCEEQPCWKNGRSRLTVCLPVKAADAAESEE
jgi:hypothetical protein